MSLDGQRADPDRYTLVPRTLTFLFQADQVLLLKVDRGGWAGLYNGIGGHLEQGEDPLTAAVRELRPAFPVLLVSGYDTMRMVDNVLALGRVRFLRKPFTREELFAVLADVVRPNPGAQA